MVFVTFYHFEDFAPRGVCSFTRVSSFFSPPGRVFVSASGPQGRAVVGFHVYRAISPPSPVSSREDFRRAFSTDAMSPACIPAPGIYQSPGMKVTLLTASDRLVAAGRAFSSPKGPILTCGFPYLYLAQSQYGSVPFRFGFLFSWRCYLFRFYFLKGICYCRDFPVVSSLSLALQNGLRA